MSSVNTVIFDFDGTLVDSFGLSVRLSNMLAPQYGYKTVTDTEVPRLKKLSAPELFRYLEFPLYKLPVVLAKARNEMSKEIEAIQLFDGIIHMLERLRAAGIHLGIVTSNSRSNVQSCLVTNGVLEKFDFVHAAKNLFGKHRTLKRLMKKMNLSNDSVIYVGDEGRDIEASKKVNIPVVAVTWGYQDRERLSKMSPDFLADIPADIEKFVLSYFKKDSSKSN
ncbi:MAG: HAD hydrolase-like protein [Deltaproteobacteria bacterium]|nr:HAD hydrolase-like protein [Deltaproteobacteria bacterium]MBN2674339.1 HAD hydrolase-like protein [Deltaproteobacteria bacterium]